MVKPNYGSEYLTVDNENDLTHINTELDIALAMMVQTRSNDFTRKYERILILAGPQIDIDEANTICSFGEALQAPIFADPLSNVRRRYNSEG